MFHRIGGNLVNVVSFGPTEGVGTLVAHGGWTDSQMPDRIYADQEADHARDEARDVRAKIRGE